MQEPKVYLELVRERGRKGLPLERVYRQLFNKDMYLRAYGKIYRNSGAMTHGVTDETPDGMSLGKIETIIELMRYERYQWLPARRTYIPKKNGKKRPLGMPVWSDKLVQEVLRQILEEYYEPQFSDHSHGFRPGRGCHTALREIYYNWHGTVWFIEGDISACFDKINHEKLLEIIQERSMMEELSTSSPRCSKRDTWKIGRSMKPIVVRHKEGSLVHFSQISCWIS
jgi:retron-type reverse transcriptase